jgi:hypothetical protein
MIKKITFRRDKKKQIMEVDVNKEFNFDILNIYQNDKDIKNIIMENHDKNNNNGRTIGEVGCRFIAGARSIIKHSFLTIKELDNLADEGDWKTDSWVDGGKTMVANVINFSTLITKVNERLNSKLKYDIYKNYDSYFKQLLIDKLNNCDSPSIKMPHLSINGWDHFINVDGYLLTKNDELFIRMKDTYKEYDGYDGYYCLWTDPKYYEFIYKGK